jgi:hypothetical protein
MGRRSVQSRPTWTSTFSFREETGDQMRERAVGVRARAKSTWLGWVGAAALTACAGASGTLVGGCAVSESDIHHWELTESGPDKLYAVMTHDKYSWALRSEAAMSLVKMRPRGGQHIGLETLLKALQSKDALTPAARDNIVKDIGPKIIDGMGQKIVKAPDGSSTDPSVSYKDAAYGLLTEPSLVSDDKLKQDLTAAVIAWVQTDFETRLDNRQQAYGVEQIMRALGSATVKALPSYIREESAKVDRIAQLVAEIGDDDSKKRAAEALVTLGKRLDSKDWMDKQRPLVEEANKKAKVEATAQQVDQQIKDFQKSELEKIFGSMKRVGQRPIIDWTLAYAGDGSKTPDLRKAAIAALQGNLDKNNQSDADKFFNIIKDDKNPDEVRGLALERMGELSKEYVVPKLYGLFSGKKWQVRLDVGRKLIEILKPMDDKAIADFMKHLPNSKDDKMGRNEPVVYGASMAKMDPVGGKKPRDILNGYLQSKDIGPRLVAIGQYWGEKKDDAKVLKSLEDDTMPVPKCDDADKCGWECQVPKPNSKDMETKKIGTVGDFVKYCVVPSLE